MPIKGKYDVILIAVAHEDFEKMKIDQIKSFGKEGHVLYDVKYVLRHDQSDGRL